MCNIRGVTVKLLVMIKVKQLRQVHYNVNSQTFRRANTAEKVKENSVSAVVQILLLLFIRSDI